VDPFALIILGIMVALIGGILLLGFYHPRSGNDVLDWKPTRSPEVEVQNEIDDLDQMLEATNERRRRRGEAELTEAGVRDQVAEDLRDANARRDRYLAAEDIQQMLAVKNEHRRKRGEPAITEAEFRAEVEAEQGPPRP
jgi:hypothetical protein